MSQRERPSGRERRELRRRARQGLSRLRWDVILTSAGVVAALAIAFVLTQFVFGGDDNEESEEVSIVGTPTVQIDATVVAQDSGPPPLSGELTLTDTGLGIFDIEEGTGETPEPGQTLVVHYTGWLSEEGTKFDSSLDRGMPFEFALGTGYVIAGWEEGFATMKVGGKRRLVIPPGLSYGDQGNPPVIPPGAWLTFDVELLEIKESP